MSSPDQIDTATDGSSPPPGWRLSRLRFVIHSNPVKSEVAHLDADQPVSFVPMEAVGEYGGLQLEADKPIGDIYNGYTYFRDADVVIAKITPCFENGKGAIAAGLTNGIAFGTTELHVARALPDCEPRFLFYLSISDPFREIGTSEMFGAGGQKRVPEDFIKNYRAAIPSKGVQEAIAAFLDHKTADIDRLIETKRALIARLNEKRQALITHAVTRGLDDGVPMKDSGVPWLGEVPAHWHVQRAKFCFDFITSGSRGWAQYYSDTGDVFFRITNLDRDSIRLKLDDIRYVEAPTGIEGERSSITEGDILVSITADLGSIGVASEAVHGGYVSQHVALCRTRIDEYHPVWLGYALAANPSRQQFQMHGYGGTKSQLSLGDVGAIEIAIPPREEQKNLAKQLTQQLHDIDKIVIRLIKQTELLDEHRSALITAAVTGQIDVRTR